VESSKFGAILGDEKKKEKKDLSFYKNVLGVLRSSVRENS
jgi:hypothetical protein